MRNPRLWLLYPNLPTHPAIVYVVSIAQFWFVPAVYSLLPLFHSMLSLSSTSNLLFSSQCGPDCRYCLLSFLNSRSDLYSLRFVMFFSALLNLCILNLPYCFYFCLLYLLNSLIHLYSIVFQFFTHIRHYLR